MYSRCPLFLIAILFSAGCATTQPPPEVREELEKDDKGRVVQRRLIHPNGTIIETTSYLYPDEDVMRQITTQPRDDGGYREIEIYTLWDSSVAWRRTADFSPDGTKTNEKNSLIPPSKNRLEHGGW